MAQPTRGQQYVKILFDASGGSLASRGKLTCPRGHSIDELRKPVLLYNSWYQESSGVVKSIFSLYEDVGQPSRMLAVCGHVYCQQNRAINHYRPKVELEVTFCGCSRFAYIGVYIVIRL